MKTRNKVFIGSGIILLLLLFAGFGLVSAYGPWSDSCRGFNPRFHDRGFFPEVIARIGPISSCGGWIKRPRN